MKWLLASGAALAVVAVVAAVVATRDSGPPPVASGPGVFRVHVQLQPDGGLRAAAHPDQATTCRRTSP
jgi:hypothetical protein